MAAKKKQNPKGEKISRTLPFKLTDSEKAQRGLEAANIQKEHDDLVIEKKSVGDTYAARIKTARARVTTLLGEIQTGIEQRSVECIAVKNFESNKVEYWHAGEKLQEREMTENDKQLHLAEQKKDKKWQKAGEKKAEAPKPETVKKVAVAAPKSQSKADKKSAEIRAVHREETSSKTAYSQLNGPRQ